MQTRGISLNLIFKLLYQNSNFTQTLGYLRAFSHGGGGPQVGEITFGGSPHLSCKRDQIEMRDYMDRRVTPPKRVSSPTWGPPPPCKQALNPTLNNPALQYFKNIKRHKLCYIPELAQLNLGSACNPGP